MKEQDAIKLEFLLTLNDIIIVQRFFNVKGYNHRVKNSWELYELMSGIQNQLQYSLKMKTTTYMLDNMDYIIQDPTIMNTSMTEGPENFNMYIKIDNETICHRLTDIFSERKLTFDYLGLPLEV